MAAWGLSLPQRGPGAELKPPVAESFQAFTQPKITVKFAQFLLILGK